jgi:hypothetical protein
MPLGVGVNHSSMPRNTQALRKFGDVVVLRYITTDGRIEMCWPCRVVEDRENLLALFIAAGSPFKAGMKATAAEKRRRPRTALPPHEHVWRNDTLRVMLPGSSHSVSLSWGPQAGQRKLLKYFINLEEPFRRTAVGFDTQDHTLDAEGFYTEQLASAARLEGERAIESMRRLDHECMRGWAEWRPPADWGIPPFTTGWDTTPPTFWEKRRWAYGEHG